MVSEAEKKRQEGKPSQIQEDLDVARRLVVVSEAETVCVRRHAGTSAKISQKPLSFPNVLVQIQKFIIIFVRRTKSVEKKIISRN